MCFGEVILKGNELFIQEDGTEKWSRRVKAWERKDITVMAFATMKF